MKYFLTIITLLTFFASAAEARLCRSSDDDDHTHYRIIDGRKCWFTGRANKSQLRWSHSNPSSDSDVKPKVVRLPEEAMPRPSAVQLNDLGTFDNRWHDMMDQLIVSNHKLEELHDRKKQREDHKQN